jgi:hypothetical protein
MTAKHLAAAAIAALTLSAPVLPAHAQSTAQLNQMTQAMQACNSSMGALIPECAQLRGPAGAANALGMLGGLGGNAGTAAGIASMLSGALGRTNVPAAPTASLGAAQGYQACVAANPSNWQACVQQMGAAGGGQLPQGSQAQGYGQPQAPAAPADPFANVFGGK